MKSGLCRKLAFGNIRKNYRFFIPRILSETGLLACFYIIYTLACDKRLETVKGGGYLPTFMLMGAVIVGLLSATLMLYTNSFLMKQRKREFGLYSVLGMEKKHICRVLFYESAICCVISVAAGMIGGIVFYKLCSLAICKLLKAEIVAGFYFITPATVIPAAAIFVAIDTVTFAVNCISIGRMKPVELLSSVNTGEKEPKVKWTMLIIGAVSLAGGYIISLTTQNPLKALYLFFAAVMLVIVGTYFLFTAGSIFVLKALKKKESYYYKPGHVTAVSGLIYRMKQNAVGLASVAILATGVLVMISTTFCLYSRTQSILDQNYPQDYYAPTVFSDENGEPRDIPENVIAQFVDSAAQKHGLKVKDGFSQEYLDVTLIHEPGDFIADRDKLMNESDPEGISEVTIITEEMYVKLGGEKLGLKNGEMAVYPFTASEKFGSSPFYLCGRSYIPVKTLTSYPFNTHLISVNCYGMVVKDDKELDAIIAAQKEAYGDFASKLQCRYCVSFENKNKAIETGDDFSADVENGIYAYIYSAGCEGFSIAGFDSFWSTREALYGMYGTLLFLGVLLGIVCLFATVLIIYYKQISEGYEDRNRYQIMQKIGMTEREVKNTIRSQIMLVFFLPLVTAGIHVAFAYPILTKMMKVLMLDNAWLFLKWCLIVYAAFALVYALIYRMTAKTYYKIVY